MYWFCRGLCTLIALLVFPITFEGRENIPKTGGYIIASNHHSLVDPVFISIGCHRQIFFLAKKELFKHKLAAWWLRAVGAFPVDRGSGDTQALEKAVGIVQRGDLLGIFPEGTRSRSGVPAAAKSGVAYIARLARCGIVPCAVIFDGPLRLFKKITVRFGKPISYAELGFDGEHSSLKHVSRRIMGVIVALMGLAPEGELCEDHNG